MVEYPTDNGEVDSSILSYLKKFSFYILVVICIIKYIIILLKN